MKLIKKIALLFGIGKKKFVWFDLYGKKTIEIDMSCLTSDGQPCPPIDCIKVAIGEHVIVYRSRDRLTLHGCIRGRAIEHDKCYGLFCIEDFHPEHYELVGIYDVKKPKPLKKREIKNNDNTLGCPLSTWSTQEPKIDPNVEEIQEMTEDLKKGGNK
jgi:hypothetical protein